MPLARGVGFAGGATLNLDPTVSAGSIGRSQPVSKHVRTKIGPPADHNYYENVLHCHVHER